MSPRYDYLIVGSGLFGATFAHLANKAGKKCLVIDKRSQLGGNVYCSPTHIPSPDGIDTVINVHKYGPHIFHTSNQEVWDFVNSIVPFTQYIHSPLSNYHGELYNLPFNMNTFVQMWPDVHTAEEVQQRIEAQRSAALATLNGRYPQNLEEQALSMVGRDIFEKLIKGYTEKQWGRSCRELPAFIIKRLPVRMAFDNNYFDDKYQGLPVGGYNRLIEGLLNGVECIPNCDFFNDDLTFMNNSWSICDNSCLKDHWQDIAEKLVYTGPIDQYFGYRLGHLEWRTLRFETRVEDTPDYQGHAVINYTSHEETYTRVIEHKHFEMFGPDVYACPKTVVTEEYPEEYSPGKEPYYPINDEQNNALAESYRSLAHQEAGVLFGGRLAEYQYYDMAPVIERAMSYFKK